MPSKRTYQLGRLQLDILHSLRDCPIASTEDLAQDIGTSVGDLRHPLRRLAAHGLIHRRERDRKGDKGRPGAVYVLFTITESGLYELRLREDRGRVPGVTIHPSQKRKAQRAHH